MGESVTEQAPLLKPSGPFDRTERVCGSYRLVITLLCMAALMLCFAHQSSMGSTMVCMTVETANGEDANPNSTTASSNITSATAATTVNTTARVDVPGEGDVAMSSILPFFKTSSSSSLGSNGTQLPLYRYDWDKTAQGWIHSSLFIGYYVTQLPSGVLASRYGGRRVAMFGLLVSSLAQLVTPVAASAGVAWLCGVRAVCGFAAGFIYAPIFGVLANWVPSSESSLLFGLAGTGMELGAVLSFSLSALVCEIDVIGGWPLAYYVLGGLGIVTVLVFSCLVSDLPSQNRWVSRHERHYIETLVGMAGGHGHKDDDSQDAPLTNKIPIWSILTSLPVWAIVVSQIGSDWLYYLIITVMPSFMEEVMLMSNTTISLLIGLPFLGIIPAIYAGGSVADYLRRKKILSTTAVRKLADFICKIFPGVILICLGFLDPGQEVVFIVLYILACVLLAFIYVSWVTNPVDLSPAYTGFITSVCETGAMWIAVVVPVVVENLTKDKTVEQWQTVLYISGGLQFVTFVFYVIFGSSLLQPWGRPDTETTVSVTRTADEGKINFQSGPQSRSKRKRSGQRKYERQQSNPYMSDSELGRRGIYRVEHSFLSDSEQFYSCSRNSHSHPHSAVTSDSEHKYFTMNGTTSRRFSSKSDHSYESMDFGPAEPLPSSQAEPLPSSQAEPLPSSQAEPLPSSQAVMESTADDPVYENVTLGPHGDRSNTTKVDSVGILPASQTVHFSSVENKKSTAR